MLSKLARRNTDHPILHYRFNPAQKIIDESVRSCELETPTHLSNESILASHRDIARKSTIVFVTHCEVPSIHQRLILTGNTEAVGKWYLRTGISTRLGTLDRFRMHRQRHRTQIQMGCAGPKQYEGYLGITPKELKSHYSRQRCMRHHINHG